MNLYWSKDGAVACANHAPYRGSDTWGSRGWQAMTVEDRLSWSRQLGESPQCETARFGAAGAAASCGDRSAVAR